MYTELENMDKKDQEKVGVKYLKNSEIIHFK